MSGKFVLFFALLSITTYTAFAKTSKVVCYFNNWTVYRNGDGKFKVSDIDPKLCTHILYAFEGIYADGTFKILDEWGDINLNQITDMMALKSRYPTLKVSVSIGGYGTGSANFPSMVASGTARANFISTSLAFIQKYGFDGLDLVWEYPGTISISEKTNFALLVAELSATYKSHNLLLSAAVAPIGDSVDRGYDVPALSKHLDMITLLSYDFHGYYDGYTGANAPLYASPTDKTYNAKNLNVNASVSYWLSLGADPQKLLIGVPFYGKSYILKSTSDNGIGAAITGPGPKGVYTQEQGIYGYNEITEFINVGGWQIVRNPDQKVPYMYKDDIWISYDDPQSMKSKVEYAKEKNLLGLSVWALGTDDFQGVSGKKNQLLSAINDAMA